MIFKQIYPHAIVNYGDCIINDGLLEEMKETYLYFCSQIILLYILGSKHFF